MSSDTAAGVLDSIDGALRDFQTSTDAMRWVPEGDRGALARQSPPPGPWIPLDGAAFYAGGSAPPVTVDVFVDAEAFTRSLSDFAAVMDRVLRPAFEDTARQFHALSAALFPKQHQRCPACHPSRKPKPLAVNGREYHRRQMARRGRRR